MKNANLFWNMYQKLCRLVDESIDCCLANDDEGEKMADLAIKETTRIMLEDCFGVTTANAPVTDKIAEEIFR